jgi:sialate O-acetylesterase
LPFEVFSICESFLEELRQNIALLGARIKTREWPSGLFVWYWDRNSSQMVNLGYLMGMSQTVNQRFIFSGRSSWAVAKSEFFHAVLAALFAICTGSPVWAQPILPHLFSDHMILQRDGEIPVWGWANPGEPISVSLAGHTRETVTGLEGRWRVMLPAEPAGGPFVLSVRGQITISFRDVLIGDVWVASGQSNMTYALSGATGGAEAASAANFADIRFFTVPRKIALAPQEDTLPASWETCTPETAIKFSAVAFFFARRIHKELNIPVGIILSAWPGTAGEEWTDPNSLRREPELQPIAARWDAEPAGVKSLAAGPMPFHLDFDDFELFSVKNEAFVVSPLSTFDDGSARSSTGGDWVYDWNEAPESAFELVAAGRGGHGFAARVAGKLDGASNSQLQANFRQDSTPIDLSQFDGIQFWVRGDGQFQFQALQPSIVDADNYSARTLAATPDWKQVRLWFKDLKQAGWGVAQPLAVDGLTGFQIINMTSVGDPDRPPSGLYEGMITPLENFLIRGAIWYQGEGNTWRAEQYRTLLPALIEGWRKNWARRDFPFLIVQLPNQGSSPELGDSLWAELREAQLMTIKKLANTGLAVTIDTGDPHNLHPPRKAEIGERLALWALGTTYGKKIVYSGPLYESAQAEGEKIRINFLFTGSGLEARGETLRGFAIAGPDRKFHWAEARIEGHVVIVSSTNVSHPVAVRYAWADSPECNLFNKEGLPASPFRTDDWPGVTKGKR